MFTIAPGLPFLTVLVDALRDGVLVPGFPDHADPLSLASATVYLPTRRAARVFAALLTDRMPAHAVLLPRIVPLGDLDDAMISMADGDLAFLPPEEAAAFLPAIDPLERRLILTGLALAWGRAINRNREAGDPLIVPSSPADAFGLAGDLANLMDEFASADVAWEAAAALVDERHDPYFRVTLDFLRIAADRWPDILAERSASDPVVRRDALLDAQRQRMEGATLAWGRMQRGDENVLFAGQEVFAPVIAAGSTGSIPATARLLSAIAKLPNGAVILPGLDQTLDEDAFASLTQDTPQSTRHSHPQALLARLLNVLGLQRRDIVSLGNPSSDLEARAQFLSQALRPAETTDQWAEEGVRFPPPTLSQAFDGIKIVEASDEREEALVVALAIREALEDPACEVAVVTPDRVLAERVAAELRRWSIEADDSAGTPLSRTEAGAFARLAAEVAANQGEALSLCALLSHPRARFGFSKTELARAAWALEAGVLRGPLLPSGFDGLRAALKSRRERLQSEANLRFEPRALRRLTVEDWGLAERLVARCATIFAAFSPTLVAQDIDMLDLTSCHRAACEAIAEDDEGGNGLFSGEDGEALAGLFDEMELASVEGTTGPFSAYPAFFTAIAGACTVRRPGSAHARVKIWGLIEARLLHVDRIVLGGLDEKTWPPATTLDAFLNRPMRATLGLTSPDQRIGQTAHDFVQALGHRDVVITRALRREGSPTVPSRFLQRMKAFAGPEAWSLALGEGARFLDMARRIDAPQPIPPATRPAPKPPADLQPLSLSVTEVETLVRDPYAIYAKHILGLDPLPAISVPLGASDRGQFIHEALGRFAQEFPKTLPSDALAHVIAFGREAFAPLASAPDVEALWWPRFERIAAAFTEWEQARRSTPMQVFAECSGRLDLGLPGGETFSLRARADRIEIHTDGSATIVDFKTGAPPTSPTVYAGFSPQLTLEAAMLMRGAFGGIPLPSHPVDLVYVHVTGGNPPLASKPLNTKDKTDNRSLADLVDEHIAKLPRLIARYRSGESGFLSRPFPQYTTYAGVYDHLARVGAWSATEGDAFS